METLTDIRSYGADDYRRDRLAEYPTADERAARAGWSDSLRTLTVPQFCALHQISYGGFYKLLKEGIGPRFMNLGTAQRIISIEEAAAWRKERTDAPQRPIRPRVTR